MTQATELRELATLLNVDSTDVTIGRRTSVSINDATEYSSVEASELNPVSTDALYLFNTENSSTYGKVSILMRSTGGGGGAAARITLKNDRSGNSSLKYFFRDSDHSTEMREKFVFTSKGELGIGTTGPSRILDIHKTDATQYDRSNIPDNNSGSTIRIINNDTANGPSYAGIHLQAYGASTNIARSFIGIVNDENWNSGGWSGSHHHLTFATRGSNFGTVRETMILTSDGNLGIGEDWGNLTTKRPMHKLDVDGAIATRQVRHSIRPSLNLDFANSKELDSRITFYRDSIATYYDSKGILKYANVNEPRFDHDPLTGESKGLLIEEDRTNIAFNSAKLTGLTPTRCDVRPALAPDGTFSGFKLVEQTSATAVSRYVNTGTYTTSAGTTYTVSAYIKANERTKLQFRLETGGVWSYHILNVDLATGTATSSLHNQANSNYTITDVGNGWKHISASIVPVASSTSLHLSIMPVVATNTYVGVAGSGLSFWGVQIEVGAFATSYIPPDTRFTSRSSTATYHDETGVLRTAPVNGARHGYKYDGRKWVETGLILEQASTNSIQNFFSNAGALQWSSNQNSEPVATSSVTAPDGSTMAFKQEINSVANGIHSIYHYGSVPVGQQLCFSVYAKAAEYDRLYLYTDGIAPTIGGIFYNLLNGTIGGGPLQPTDSYGIENVGDGWYRCWFSGTPTSGTTAYFHIDIAQSDNGRTFAGTVGQGVYLWGPQREYSSSPSSYIYTDTGNVTRSADVSSSTAYTRALDSANMYDILYADWNREEEGTFYVEHETPYDIEDISVNYRVLERNNGITGNYISILHNAGTNQLNAGSNVDTAWESLLGVSSPYGEVDKNTVWKTAIGFKENDFGVSIQGSPIAQDSTGLTPIGNHTLSLGNNWQANNALNGHLKLVKFYPERLSNAELVSLTENN